MGRATRTLSIFSRSSASAPTGSAALKIRHEGPAGYEVIGNLFYKAILKGFADYLESGP